MRLALAGALLLAAASPLVAQRSLAIDRFHADVAVGADGTIEVAETITATFTGSWNGLYRKVPVQYRTPQGFNWAIRLELLGATDDRGTALETETLREGHYLRYKVWVPGAQDATRTITLRYRATNALRFFEDHDELYWNATGDEWDVPLGATSATVTLPAGVTGVRATAFNGVYGSTSRDAQVAAEGRVVRVTMPRSLEFREGLTVVVGWDKGLVREPGTADRLLGFLQVNWPLLLPFGAFAGMFTLWRRRGRDPSALPVAVQYEPPDALTPAEVGTLLDESADMRDITATLVDLAVRGFVRIEETEEEALFGLIKNREYVFHRTGRAEPGTPLLAHERRVLDGIFRGGATRVPLTDLRNEFYREIPGIRSALMERLVERKYYPSRPDSVRARWMAGAVATGIAVVVLGVVVAPRQGLTPVPFVAGGALSALIVAVFGYLMPARTVSGARARERVLGFREFLERVDGERLRRVTKTPELFERFLPFAMAYGVERNWARAFEGIYREPPRWYSGPRLGHFDMARFSGSLADMSSRAGTAMQSTPRQSSGSGFGGGGFSGGGGGGGGGGGF